jgi:DNA-binding HxlR family transcriptional regulator
MFDQQSLTNALRAQIPVSGLKGIRIVDVTQNASEAFDVSFHIECGLDRVPVFAQFQHALTPKKLDGIAPWIARLKAIQPGVSFAVIAPSLSLQSQEYCMEHYIDFFDLAGNVAIHVPGRLVLRRLGMRPKKSEAPRQEQGIVEVFSGRASRVLRVLLQKKKPWRLNEIAREIRLETRSLPEAWTSAQVSFDISMGTISKVLATLEQELLIRRTNSTIVVPEPRQLLGRWAERYKERYKARLRGARTKPNPYRTLEDFTHSAPKDAFALTGPAGIYTKGAPFVSIDVIDVLVALPDGEKAFPSGTGPAGDSGTNLRFIDPYDFGVFMYAKPAGNVLLVSDVQCYLDLFARSGRDLKQAEYLLEKKIVPNWFSAE